VGNDLWEGKVTLPLIYALEGAGAADRQMVASVLQDRNYERVPFTNILELISRRRGIERVRERARRFTETARARIGEFPASPISAPCTPSPNWSPTATTDPASPRPFVSCPAMLQRIAALPAPTG